MGVRVRWSGQRPRLWRSVISELEKAEELTRDNDVVTLTMCVNYGGRQEIVGAAKELARQAARSGSGRPEILVITSTLVMGASMVAAAAASGWLTLAAVALAGAGEGPQLTALFAIRHRETPARMRGQVYTTAASLKIAGLAGGAALGGPLAGHSVTACLLIAAGTELCAAACGLLS